MSTYQAVAGATVAGTPSTPAPFLLAPGVGEAGTVWPALQLPAPGAGARRGHAL